MKKLAIPLALALNASLALAGGTPSGSGTSDPGASTGKASAQGAGDTYLAREFWDKNAKSGYLGKEEVEKFKGADGKAIDMHKLDTDNDGKVSEREWTTYHQTAGAAGVSPPTSSQGSTTK